MEFTYKASLFYEKGHNTSLFFYIINLTLKVCCEKSLINVDLKRKNRNRATKKAQDRKNMVEILVGVQKVMLQPKHMTSTTGSQTCLCERLCR